MDWNTSPTLRYEDTPERIALVIVTATQTRIAQTSHVGEEWANVIATLREFRLYRSAKDDEQYTLIERCSLEVAGTVRLTR